MRTSLFTAAARSIWALTRTMHRPDTLQDTPIATLVVSVFGSGYPLIDSIEVFMPGGMRYAWPPEVLALHIVSDALIVARSSVDGDNPGVFRAPAQRSTISNATLEARVDDCTRSDEKFHHVIEAAPTAMLMMDRGAGLWSSMRRSRNRPAPLDPFAAIEESGQSLADDAVVIDHHHSKRRRHRGPVGGDQCLIVDTGCSMRAHHC
jgi:hypothetical protein